MCGNPQHTAEFAQLFTALTDHPPLSWQTRLFEQHFAKNQLPPLIDLPTGLGKTMVMAIWLIARVTNRKLPTRLIYVVDRRTVVDQATDLAEKLVKNWGDRRVFDGRPPAISTLRGQRADNREWSRDPSRPAIVIGTVDLIGSALLFSGYRSSYKRRPLEAGLLGQDSLLVLDEAHLSKPFEKLLGSISDFQNSHGTPMQVVRMSATSSNAKEGDVFRLDTDQASAAFDLWSELDEKGAEKNQVKTRFEAKKRLTIIPLGEKEKLTERLASEAIKLAEDDSLRGKRIVVFVRKPDDARSVADKISKHGAKKNSQSPYAKSVEVLTGTMRGLERDELIEKAVLKRFLDGDENPDLEENKKPAFLISTSAGEVGFDLNADHLVGDETTLDSWIQRLGRVNRRGMGIAIVQAFVESISEPTVREGDGGKRTIASASARAVEVLKQLPHAEPLDADTRPGPVLDASPRALRNLLKPDEALSPPPSMVDLTDILLDAWSMTSIAEPMPGRPEVGPWLRGIADELPQTTVAWRAELDEPGFTDLGIDDIEDWFDTHRVLTHETLSVPTAVAAKWFTDRWDELPESGRSQLADQRIVVDRAGMTLITVNSLVKQLSRKVADNTATIRNADVVLPASFGGIERGVGLLDPAAPEKSPDDKAADGPMTAENARQRRAAPDVADIVRGRPRLREIITTTEDGGTEATAVASGTMPQKAVTLRLDLESDDDRHVRLVSHVPRRERPEFGPQRQALRVHVDAVCAAIDGILEHVGLPDSVKAEISLAARSAARFHDHGKNRERWQRCVGGEATRAGQEWLSTTLGKSSGGMKRDPRGYRHEFGSLREFADAFDAGKVLDDAGRLINQGVFDLTMHLIATHHGRGRPHFPRGGFDPDRERRSDDIHTESIRRFARLQRKYGWWQLAWLENLLRCADGIASARIDDDEHQDDGPEADK